MNAETKAAPANPLVDWSLAASTGAMLARGGPSVSREEAGRAVADLRDLTVDAERYVRALTGLGEGLPIPPATVVDRPGWVRSAAAGLGELTSRAVPPERASTLSSLVAGGAGVQTGVVLAFLGSRVLGQYDPFGGPDTEGELVLVAPNVVTAQQAMNVPGRDFRLWVCLHECTHRLQFTAVDWLRDYFAGEVGKLVGGFAGSDETITATLQRLPENLRSLRESVK